MDNEWIQEDLIMPFGKFKGTKMSELPCWYLKWLAENFNETEELSKVICLTADWLYQNNC